MCLTHGRHRTGVHMDDIGSRSVFGGFPEYQARTVCWLFQLRCSWRVALECLKERISEPGICMFASVSIAAERRQISEAPIGPRLKNDCEAREDKTGDDDN